MGIYIRAQDILHACQMAFTPAFGIEEVKYFRIDLEMY